MTLSIRTALGWGATFLAFPLGGLIARLFGPVDSTGAAVLAGLVAGAVVGGAQSFVLARGAGPRLSFAVVSAAGMAAGLALGSFGVGYMTTTSALVVQGLINGLVLGGAQALLILPPPRRRTIAWPLLTSVAWGLGWLTTSSIGVDVERRYAVFGASGALVATVVTGLGVLLATRRPDAVVA